MFDILPICPSNMSFCCFCSSTVHLLFNVSGIAHQHWYIWRLSWSARWAIQSASHSCRWCRFHFVSSEEGDQHRKWDKRWIIIDWLMSLPVSFKNQLLNWEEFSLSSASPAGVYEQVVVPTLQRMINLKKWSFSLEIDWQERFIDGNHLERECHSSYASIGRFHV